MTAEQKDRELAGQIAERLNPGSLANGWHPMGRELKETARTLRRAQMTLHRWAELECGTGQGHIEREDHPHGMGRPYFVPDWRGRGPGGITRHPIPDREAGALRRVAEVCKATGLHFYHQTDPRGCALYVAAEPLTDQNYSTRGIPCL